MENVIKARAEYDQGSRPRVEYFDQSVELVAYYYTNTYAEALAMAASGDLPAGLAWVKSAVDDVDAFDIACERKWD